MVVNLAQDRVPMAAVMAHANGACIRSAPMWVLWQGGCQQIAPSRLRGDMTIGSVPEDARSALAAAPSSRVLLGLRSLALGPRRFCSLEPSRCLRLGRRICSSALGEGCSAMLDCSLRQERPGCTEPHRATCGRCYRLCQGTVLSQKGSHIDGNVSSALQAEWPFPTLKGQ